MRFWIGLIVLILAASIASGDAQSWVTARWVADGDTIVLQDGRHVRYIGIDTPEIDHKNHRAAPMGYEAQSMNRQLVEGWQLRLVDDREKTDRYGRALAYVYRSDGLFVNAELVKGGFAHVLYHFPNTRNLKTLLSGQRDAMKAGRGIWRFVDKDEKPLRPYRGNRRSKRFHADGCPMGDKISQKNRVHFANQWAAFWAGYAPARECIEFPKGK
ncbi:MAG: thermonuclease family protein [Desulfosarcina sp.]|nr:thermonuclease family protein [Desulfosarcina sp.]MBC2741976.1 thermonuclease family protein [Desulfosarcina sp.]MBC2764889.1 thermonuclease family protein [Desulfosarcina sp.]